MKSKKMLVLTLAMMVWLAGLGMANNGYAEDFNMGGRFGIGAQSNLLNFGIGPDVEFWLTDNVGVSASFGTLADYTSYGIRGNYLFDKRFDLFGMSTRPYAGIGFSSVTGPEYSFLGSTSKTEGSGLEMYGGVLQQASENIYLRSEFIYSTINLTTTIDGTEFDADYGAFSLGFGIVYYF